MKSLAGLGAALAMVLASASHAEVSDNVVKIGVLTDMSGIISDSTGSGSMMAARIAVEDFGGTVLGKPIEIGPAEHQNKPDVRSNITRQWLDTQHVDVIADVPISSIALAVQNLTRERNRIFLNSSAGSSDLSGPACSPAGIRRSASN